jgi:hypothetical protein
MALGPDGIIYVGSMGAGPILNSAIFGFFTTGTLDAPASVIQGPLTGLGDPQPMINQGTLYALNSDPGSTITEYSLPSVGGNVPPNYPAIPVDVFNQFPPLKACLVFPFSDPTMPGICVPDASDPRIAFFTLGLGGAHVADISGDKTMLNQFGFSTLVSVASTGEDVFACTALYNGNNRNGMLVTVYDPHHDGFGNVAPKRFFQYQDTSKFLLEVLDIDVDVLGNVYALFSLLATSVSQYQVVLYVFTSDMTGVVTAPALQFTGIPMGPDFGNLGRILVVSNDSPVT